MTIAEKILRAKTDYDEVYEAGKKSAYDEFWDTFQWDGTRTYYQIYAFAQGGWSFDNFYPKYDIIPEGPCQYLFYGWNVRKNYTDYEAITGSLKARLEECGVKLDTSKVTLFRSLFSYGRFTELPTIDFTGATSEVDGAFGSNPLLVTIEKIVVNESVKYRNLFTDCPLLENLVVEGVIGQNGLNLQWSTKLSKASITSIINALSTTTSGLAVTLSGIAVKNAFETSSGAYDGIDSAEWKTLIGTKSNWTINLV